MIKKFFLENQILIKSIAKKSAMGLGCALVVMVFSILFADLLYHTKKNTKRGFVIDAKPQTENIGGVAVGSLPDLKSGAKNSIAKVDIETLIKNADLNAGAKVAKKCLACHTFAKGEKNKIGPNLYGIVGRKKASAPGFIYSDAIRSKGGVWAVQDIDQFIASPKAFVPGTKMGFAGLKKDKDRANVIAYLKQQAK